MTTAFGNNYNSCLLDFISYSWLPFHNKEQCEVFIVADFMYSENHALLFISGVTGDGDETFWKQEITENFSQSMRRQFYCSL